MKSLLRAIVCSVLVVGLTLFGLGGMKPAQAGVELACQDVIGSDSPVRIQPNVTVTLCPKVSYVYIATDKETAMTFTNLSDYMKSEIFMNWTDKSRVVPIPPGGVQVNAYQNFGGGVKVRVSNRSEYAPIKAFFAA